MQNEKRNPVCYESTFYNIFTSFLRGDLLKIQSRKRIFFSLFSVFFRVDGREGKTVGNIFRAIYIKSFKAKRVFFFSNFAKN